MNKKRGLFISVEGPDGSGKTSVGIPHIRKLLEDAGIEYVTGREPGGTKMGEDVRYMLFNNMMTPMSEILLFGVQRAENLAQIIKPTVERGAVALFDRFTDSTYAYQGLGRGFVKEMLAVEKLVVGEFQPDCTLFFDVSLEESRNRLSQRSAAKGEINRFDEERSEFHARVYEGYQIRLREFPERMYRINAMQPIEGVKRELDHWFNNHFQTLARSVGLIEE